MSYLQNLETICEDNLGSVIVNIQIARVDDIDTFPEIINHQITDPVIFKSGRGFLQWTVSQDSASFTSKDGNSEAGHTKKNTLPFLIPKDRQDVYSMLMKAQYDTFIIIYKDGNGVQRMMGTPDAPALFLFDFKTGKKLSSLNNYNAEFYTESPFNFNFYDTTATAQPGTSVPAIVKRGDGTVIATLQPGQVLILTSPYSIGYNIVG